MIYRVTIGFERAEVSAVVAREYWDETPVGLRSGDRERAFILWDLSPQGYLTSPILFMPVKPGT